MKFPAVDETSRADGSRFGGIVSSWLGQGTTTGPGKPRFREMDLKLRKIAAFIYQTDEMAADAIALEGWVTKNLPLELVFRVEDAVVNGDGSNKPVGLLNNGSVIKVNRKTANQITSADLRAMYYSLWAPLRKTAVFLIDQELGASDRNVEHPSSEPPGVLDPNYRPAGTGPGTSGNQIVLVVQGLPHYPGGILCGARDLTATSF